MCQLAGFIWLTAASSMFLSSTLVALVSTIDDKRRSIATLQDWTVMPMGVTSGCTTSRKSGTIRWARETRPRPSAQGGGLQTA